MPWARAKSPRAIIGLGVVADDRERRVELALLLLDEEVGIDLGRGQALEDVVDPLGHEDEGLELGAGLERVQGLDPGQDVDDPVDARARGAAETRS